MKYIKTYEGLFDFFKKKKEPKIDYNKIIDNISASRSQVQKFTPSILQ